MFSSGLNPENSDRIDHRTWPAVGDSQDHVLNGQCTINDGTVSALGIVPTFPQNPSSTEQAHGTLSTFWHPILALDADQSQQHTSKENEVKNAKAADRRQRAQYRTILKTSVSRKQTNYPLTLGYWGSLNCVPDISQLPVSTRRAPKPARRVHFVDQTEVEPHAPFFPHRQHVSQEQGYEAGITGIREQAQTPSKYEVIPSFEYSYEPVQGPIDEERDPSPSDEQILDPNIDPTLDSIVFPWQLYTNGKAG